MAKKNNVKNTNYQYLPGHDNQKDDFSLLLSKKMVFKVDCLDAANIYEH